MIFSIIVILLIAAVTYFHYTQGLFSATLSAIIAVIAAVLAFSYHETIVYAFLAGKLADYAHGIVLVGLFALAYLILRVIFDKFIPGNISLPLYVDRVGAAVMGIIVGIVATGVLTVAAGTLPFGPGTPYPRYLLSETQDVSMPGPGGREIDVQIYGQLRDAEPGKFNAENAAGMIVPVDNMVINLVDRLSTGSLAGKQPLAAVHPSYLDEMFFNRLGVQVGANRVAVNLPAIQQVNLGGVYSLEQIAQADSEYEKIRPPSLKTDKIAALRKPGSNEVLLVARIGFTQRSDDSDHHVRLSPATVRLVANGKNHIPLGTIDPEGVLRLNLPDDFLVVPAEQSVDFVYQIPVEDLGLTRSRNEISGSIREGVFLEAKRMGQLELGGKSLAEYPGPLERTVLQKQQLPAPKAPSGATATAPPPSAGTGAGAPIVFDKVQVSNALFTPVNVGSAEEDSPLTFASGTATVRETKFLKLSVNSTQTIELLSRGEYAVKEFFVPPGMKMVQIVAKPGTDRWVWADKLNQFELVDTNNGKHKPRGAWAKLQDSRGAQRMVATYDAEKDADSLPSEEAVPIEVYIAFHVPEGTQLKELMFESKRVAAVNEQVN